MALVDAQDAAPVYSDTNHRLVEELKAQFYESDSGHQRRRIKTQIRLLRLLEEDLAGGQVASYYLEIGYETRDMLIHDLMPERKQVEYEAQMAAWGSPDLG